MLPQLQFNPSNHQWQSAFNDYVKNISREGNMAVSS